MNYLDESAMDEHREEARKARMQSDAENHFSKLVDKIQEENPKLTRLEAVRKARESITDEVDED